jgi:hypothetical protein
MSLIAIVVLATPALAYDPYPFQRSDGKWGYVDDEHCWVIEPRFESAGHFSEGAATAWASGGGGWQIIDTDGKVLSQLPLEHLIDYIGNFKEGLAPVRVFKAERNWGVIDLKGHFVIEAKYDFVEDFSEGMAVVSLENEGIALAAKGFVSSDGSLVVAPKYQIATKFVGGLAAMGDLGSVGIINKNGIFEIPPFFLSAGEFSDGLAYVVIDGKYGFINGAGRMVIQPVFDDVRSFSEGLAWVSVNKKAGFINTQGVVVIAPEYDAAFPFSEGLSAVQIGEKWGYIDHEGRMVIPAVYDFANPFKHGRASVLEGERYFIISKSGQILLDPTCNHTR